MSVVVGIGIFSIKLVFKLVLGWKGGKLKKKGEVNGEILWLWEGFFEVIFNIEKNGFLVLEFRDLWEGIVGGEKMWIEFVKCFFCVIMVN